MFVLYLMAVLVGAGSIVHPAAAMQASSLSLDGNSRLVLDRLARYENLLAIPFDDSGAFEMWIHPSSTPAHEVAVILQSGVIPTGMASAILFEFQFNYRTRLLQLNKWSMRNNLWNILPIRVTTPILLDSWTHVAFSTSKRISQSMFIDGISASPEILSSSYSTPNVPPCEFAIGERFTGYIDEVRIWNHTRSEYEITSGMPTSVCDEDGLVLHLDFDSFNPEGATVDVSSNGACGRIVPDGKTRIPAKSMVPFHLGVGKAINCLDHENKGLHAASTMSFGPQAPADVCDAHAIKHLEAYYCYLYPDEPVVDPTFAPLPSFDSSSNESIPVHTPVIYVAFILMIVIAVWYRRVRKARVQTVYQQLPQTCEQQHHTNLTNQYYPVVFIDTQQEVNTPLFYSFAQPSQPQPFERVSVPSAYAPVVYYMPQSKGNGDMS